MMGSQTLIAKQYSTMSHLGSRAGLGMPVLHPGNLLSKYYQKVSAEKAINTHIH